MRKIKLTAWFRLRRAIVNAVPLFFMHQFFYWKYALTYTLERLQTFFKEKIEITPQVETITFSITFKQFRFFKWSDTYLEFCGSKGLSSTLEILQDDQACMFSVRCDDPYICNIFENPETIFEHIQKRLIAILDSGLQNRSTQGLSSYKKIILEIEPVSDVSDFQIGNPIENDDF